MTISLLIPTRDRLEYLEMAVQTILLQDFSDWEIVIADNASQDDVESYVESLDDSRIIYTRSERPIPVTENWNRALEASTGDWVLMLGDDDGLLPNALHNLNEIVSSFRGADLVYSGALLYTYPGVDPHHPKGFVQSQNYAKFIREPASPFVLDPKVAKGVVRNMMNFRLRYGFNMQFALVNRSLIQTLSRNGPFYRSEFPDYYSMNMLFLRSQEIVVNPTNTVIIGATPKSYGYYHANSKEQDGRKFLQARSTTSTINYINDGWLDAARNIATEYTEENIAPNFRRYRMLQLASLYEKIYIDRSFTTKDLSKINPPVKPIEHFALRGITSLYNWTTRLLPSRLKKASKYIFMLMWRQFPHWSAERRFYGHQNIIDLINDTQTITTLNRR